MKYLLLVILTLSSHSASAKNIAYLLTRYMAKEYCSCRYVVKQSPQVCRKENKSFKTLFRIVEDIEKKTITVSNLATKTKARFISDEYGCLLEKDL